MNSFYHFEHPAESDNHGVASFVSKAFNYSSLETALDTARKQF